MMINHLNDFRVVLLLIIAISSYDISVKPKALTLC